MEVARKEDLKENEEKISLLIKKYNINLEKLEKEQIKLGKNLDTKDKINFDLIGRIAGIENVFFKNQIISAIVVINKNFELIEQEYFSDKIRFPYIPGFRAYRELPCMIEAFNKLDEKPDLVFIRGHGILHPRGLGIASHFALTVNVPVIGIAESLLIGETEEDSIFLDVKLAGKILKTKEGANPIYISPGNKISVSSALKMTKKFIKEPHKFPEPLRLAKRYAKEIRKELFKS